MSMHVTATRPVRTALSKADRRHNIRRDGSPLGNAALVGLRLLALLRSTSPIALAGSMLLVPAQYRDGVSNRSIALLFMVLVVFALFTWRLVARAPRVSQWQLFRHAHLDILALTAMLYMTGGTNNPFAPLFLLLMPVAVTVTALRPSLIWTTFATTLLAYFCVRWSTAPTANNMIGPAWFTLHEDGMLANYVTIATVLVFYLTRTIRAVILREQLLSESRMAQTRSETVVALGALAAGYAHELGTPLGTIAIVVGELKRTHGANPQLRQDLEVIESQIQSCKATISSLTRAREHNRLSTSVSMPADDFLRALVEQVRLSRGAPGIKLTLDLNSPPPHILADETLRQAITNLVDNAVRASPSKVSVRVNWSSEMLHIIVCDAGPGFPGELLETLGKGVHAAEGRLGFGLGLLLSATIFESLGGRLDLSNASGGGAVAEASIPLSAILVDPGRSMHEP